MTPEAKAREIELAAGALDVPPTWDQVLSLVVQALRDVERETLERAAKLAENFAVSSVHDDCATAIDFASDAIAQSIRALINSGREGEI